ncbi:MAG: hypothetical protein A2265_02720 [Bacteroidetes bacterium RIFOXYA12_FULL_33_9]|nr:MAG: hypothetical protein A2265_02720 [Bacteroidetes bacterium RIFOXYA12_FULL_33_9]
MSSILNSIGNFFLKYKLKQLTRKRGCYNLDSAKTIGVVFNATNQQNYEIARSFIKYLMAGDIKVEGLGFVNSTEVLDFYSYQTGVSFFSKKNLNWYKKPKHQTVEDFIAKEFDILLDITVEDDFPTKYIVSLSKAKFKVGRLTEKADYMDFMIDISKNNKSIYLIEQINHYLSLINKKQ